MVGDTTILYQRVNRTAGARDRRWTAVSANRTVAIIDPSDRVLCTAWRVAGVDYADFDIMSRAERLTVEDLSRQIFLDIETVRAAAEAAEELADSWLPAWDLKAMSKRTGKIWSYGKNAIMGLGAQRAFGSLGMGAFILWRVATYLEVMS